MITDLDARKIASEWHGGGGTALYAFASTGAIDTARADHDLAGEIDENRAHGIHGTPELDDLDNLMAYVRRYTAHRITRGPVDGWANLTW